MDKVVISVSSWASLAAQRVKNLPAMRESSESKESACNAGDPGEGNGYPPQYCCLENSMERGAWRATVHGVTKSLHDQASY